MGLPSPGWIVNDPVTLSQS